MLRVKFGQNLTEFAKIPMPESLKNFIILFLKKEKEKKKGIFYKFW
jgi:hypothetical protein